jgi:hypothetical protein
MSDPNGFWQPLDLIVDLFTQEGRRNLRGFFVIILSAAVVFLAAVYIATGHGPWAILTNSRSATICAGPSTPRRRCGMNMFRLAPQHEAWA